MQLLGSQNDMATIRLVRMAVSNIPMAVNMIVFVMMSMHMLMGMRMFTFHFPILLMLY